MNESYVEPSSNAWLRSRAPVPTTYAPACEPLYPFQEILENRTSRARGTTGSCTEVSARKFAVCIEIWQVKLESCVWRVSFHKYAYVHGDPIQGIDPTGMFMSSGGLGTNLYLAYKSASIALNALGFISNTVDAIQALYSGKIWTAAYHATWALINGAALILEAFNVPTPPPAGGLALVGSGGGLFVGAGGAISIGGRWQVVIKNAPALANWAVTTLMPTMANSAAGIAGSLIAMQGGGFRGGDGFTTDNIRGMAGRASGGKDLPLGDANWLETGMGYFPRQVADILRGQYFSSFRKFREAFWKAVSDVPVLKESFSAQNQARIRDGLAPFARELDQVGGRTKFELDHMETLEIMGKQTLMNMDEIMVASPRIHGVLSK